MGGSGWETTNAPALQFALSRLPRSKSQSLYSAFTKFEKQHGTRSGVESTVLGKRRIQYEEELSHDQNNYVRRMAPCSCISRLELDPRLRLPLSGHLVLLRPT